MFMGCVSAGRWSEHSSVTHLDVFTFGFDLAGHETVVTAALQRVPDAERRNKKGRIK